MLKWAGRIIILIRFRSHLAHLFVFHSDYSVIHLVTRLSHPFFPFWLTRAMRASSLKTATTSYYYLHLKVPVQGTATFNVSTSCLYKDKDSFVYFYTLTRYRIVGRQGEGSQDHQQDTHGPLHSLANRNSYV